MGGSHGVVLKGFRLDDKGNIKYLLVQNSWGSEAYENGMFVLDRKFLQDYSQQAFVPSVTLKYLPSE